MDFIKHYMLPTLIKTSKKTGIISAIVFLILFQLITIIVVCPFPWDVLLMIVYGIIDYTCVTAYEQYKEDQKRINCGQRPIYRK